MQQTRFHPESGTTLVFSLVLSILLFGFAGSITLHSITSAREINEATDRQLAFYLAEAGLEASQNELTRQKDPAGDGIGTVTVNTPMGVYQVVATDVGGGAFQLQSAGTANGRQVTLQQIVTLVSEFGFPQGAISFVGDVDQAKVEVKKHAGLIIDGGTQPAFAFSNEELFDEVTQEVAESILKGEIDPNNITGSNIQTIETDYGSVDLSADSEQLEDSFLDGLSDVYEQLLANVEAQAAMADKETEKLGKGTDLFVYGTPENPATVHFTQKVELKQNDQITGYGTLIISEEFKLKDDSVLNWVGDVIVFADDEKKAKLEIDGKFNVTGNVIVLGEGNEEVEFKIKDDAVATIDGAFFIGTQFDEDKGKKAKIEVDGALTVSGVMTGIGSKLEIKFKEDSDFHLNGALQLGLAEHENKEELKLEFKGDVEILRDDVAIQAGMESLMGLEAQFPLLTTVVETNVLPQYWGQVHESGYQSSSEGTTQQP